jgi:hypothetical protein
MGWAPAATVAAHQIVAATYLEVINPLAGMILRMCLNLFTTQKLDVAIATPDHLNGSSLLR